MAADPYDVAEQRVELRHLGCVDVLVDPFTALAARGTAISRCTSGDTLVVTTLSRLAYSLSDLRGVLAELAARELHLQVGSEVYDLERPERSLSEAINLMAEFEGDLTEQRAEVKRRDDRVARRGRSGRKPKLTAAQENDMARLYLQGLRSADELARDYRVGTSTVYRILDRAQPTAASTVADEGVDSVPDVTRR